MVMNWWRAGADMTRLWRMSFETWSAATYVITERTAMMQNATCFPASFDMVEFGRMVPEKVDAFGRGMASAALARNPIEAASRALAPVHASARANAKRLRKR